MMNAVDDFIRLWPSFNDFAADAGVSTQHARVMKHRQSIPAIYWAAIEEGAKRRGIKGATASDLARIAALGQYQPVE